MDQLQHIRPGLAVYDARDEKVGEVAGRSDRYLRVPTGVLGLGSDYYVPLSAIRRMDAKGVFLSIDKDRMHDYNWDVEPEGYQDWHDATGDHARDAGFAGAGGPHSGHRETAPTSYTPVTGSAAYQRVPVHEEELVPQTHQEQVGEVVVGREVVEEDRSFEVPVTHEEVIVERRPIAEGEALTAAGELGEGEVIRVPVYKEVVEVEKEVRVAEEVLIQPETVTTQEHVEGTVRREVPRVQTTGDAKRFVRGDALAGDRDTPPPERKVS